MIFNHILSRISRPESGNCITLTMVAMSVLLAERGRSSNSGMEKEPVEKPQKGEFVSIPESYHRVNDSKYGMAVLVCCVYRSAGKALSRQ